MSDDQQFDDDQQPDDGLTPELREILRQAEENGCLVQGHPDNIKKSQDAKPPVVVPRFWEPKGVKGKDPRTMGPQPQQQDQNGYSHEVDSPEWKKKFWGHE